MMNILVIEDNMDHFELIEDALLTTEPGNVTIHHETMLSKGLDMLDKQSFDILLCDLQLPDAPIETTVDRLKQLRCTTPIIVLTSLNSTNVAKELLKKDIQDYLPKEDLSPTLLNRMCVYAIERKNRQLLLQKRNADMQTFCASLSHDFKGHLRRIGSIGELLQEILEERIELDAEELKWFVRLDKSTTGIQKLVDGLSVFLSAGHIDATMEEVNLSSLFVELQKSIVETTDKNPRITIEDDIPSVTGNASQLNILFHNLITNGIKYNQNDPHIQVSAQEKTAQTHCDISIKDNGIGIDEAFLQKIFSPFTRLHGDEEFSGSGLGLSIVNRIVEHHDGDIRVESSKGNGSTFIVSLPVASRPQ